jgi:hypothetical protein
MNTTHHHILSVETFEDRENVNRPSLELNAKKP